MGPIKGSTLHAAPEQSDALEVTPRRASMGPGILLGPIGGLLDTGENGNAGAFETRVPNGRPGMVARERRHGK